MDNPLVPNTTQAGVPAALSAMALGGLSQVKIPVGTTGSWLPELRFAWPVSNITGADGSNGSFRLFLGEKDAPEFLPKGTVLVPLSGRNVIQVSTRVHAVEIKSGRDIEIDKHPMNDYHVGHEGGARKGENYADAIKMIAGDGAPPVRFEKEYNFRKDLPVDDPKKHSAQYALTQVKPGVSFLCAIIRPDGMSTVASFPMYGNLVQNVAASFMHNGLEHGSGLEMTGDNLQAGMDLWEEKQIWTFKSKLIPRALRPITLTADHRAAILRAYEMDAEAVGNWRNE